MNSHWSCNICKCKFQRKYNYTVFLKQYLYNCVTTVTLLNICMYVCVLKPIMLSLFQRQFHEKLLINCQIWHVFKNDDYHTSKYIRCIMDT